MPCSPFVPGLDIEILETRRRVLGPEILGANLGAACLFGSSQVLRILMNNDATLRRMTGNSGLSPGLHCDSVVYLSTVHTQRAIVVEDQGIEEQRAANGERLRIEHLCIAVDVDLNLAQSEE